MITFNLLKAYCPEGNLSNMKKLVDPLNETIKRYDIDTNLRLIHFLAQIAHESDSFHALREYADGSAYEFREDLGNTSPGDGRKYKG